MTTLVQQLLNHGRPGDYDLIILIYRLTAKCELRPTGRETSVPSAPSALDLQTLICTDLVWRCPKVSYCMCVQSYGGDLTVMWLCSLMLSDRKIRGKLTK